MELPDKLSLDIINEQIESNNKQESNIIPCILDNIINYPYFTLEQMKDIGIDINNYKYNKPDNYLLDDKITVTEWYKEYELFEKGIVTEDYITLNNLRHKKILELYNGINTLKDEKLLSRKQSILNLGWNPEIDYYNINIREEVNNLMRKEWKDKFNPMITEDYTNIQLSLESLNESSFYDTSRYKPLYVVLSFTYTGFGKLISTVTNCKFSHSALALDSKLDKLYTYNAAENGFAIESLPNYIKISDKRGIMCVYAVLVNNKLYKQIKEKIDDYVNNKKITSYSYLTGLGAAINHPLKDSGTSMICSQFVDMILKLGKKDISKKTSNIITPADLYNIKDRRIIKLFEGKMTDYNAREIESKIRLAIKKKESKLKK